MTSPPGEPRAKTPILVRPERQCRRRRQPWSLTRPERGRMLRIESALDAARRDDDAELRHKRPAVERVARRRREGVAIGVDNAKIGRVVAAAGMGRGGRQRRQVRQRPLAQARPQLRGVPVREQPLERHVDEARIAVEALAIRERELDRLRHDVHVLRAVVAKHLEIEAVENGERLEQRRPLGPCRWCVHAPAGGDVRGVRARSRCESAPCRPERASRRPRGRIPRSAPRHRPRKRRAARRERLQAAPAAPQAAAGATGRRRAAHCFQASRRPSSSPTRRRRAQVRRRCGGRARTRPRRARSRAPRHWRSSRCRSVRAPPPTLPVRPGPRRRHSRAASRCRSGCGTPRASPRRPSSRARQRSRRCATRRCGRGSVLRRRGCTYRPSRRSQRARPPRRRRPRCRRARARAPPPAPRSGDRQRPCSDRRRASASTTPARGRCSASAPRCACLRAPASPPYGDPLEHGCGLDVGDVGVLATMCARLEELAPNAVQLVRPVSAAIMDASE